MTAIAILKGLFHLCMICLCNIESGLNKGNVADCMHRDELLPTALFRRGTRGDRVSD